MWILSGKASICRSSGILQMLIKFRLGSFPAAYKTITSVPPAIGSHWAGSPASKERTACRLPGETSMYSAGSALILQLFAALRSQPLRKSACNRCSGKDYLRVPLVYLPEQAPVFFLADVLPQESFPACRCRTAHHRIRGTPRTRDSSEHGLKVLRW